MLLRRNRSNFPTLFNDRTSAETPVRLSTWIDDLFEDAIGWNGSNGNTFFPEMNVYETEKEFELTVALPGMQKDDFEINYENGLLTISGERKMEHEGNGRRYHRVESRFGRFSRSMPLPRDIINQDKITAKYENGVLYVTVPKIKEKAGKKIEVN
jgi:HSP20 family protein